MYYIFVNVIAWIAIVWWILVLFYSIVVYIIYTWNNDSKFTCVTRDIDIYKTDTDTIYFIPTVGFRFSLPNHSYPTIELIWLCWIMCISYHIKTNHELDIEAEVRRTLNKEN